MLSAVVRSHVIQKESIVEILFLNCIGILPPFSGFSNLYTSSAKKPKEWNILSAIQQYNSILKEKHTNPSLEFSVNWLLPEQVGL